MSDEDDIVLAELSDDDLVLQMHDDLYDGLKEEIEEGTQILLDRGWSAEKVLSTALVDGMTIVGIDFRDGRVVASFVDASTLLCTSPSAEVAGAAAGRQEAGPPLGAVWGTLWNLHQNPK